MPSILVSASESLILRKRHLIALSSLLSLGLVVSCGSTSRNFAERGSGGQSASGGDSAADGGEGGATSGGMAGGSSSPADECGVDALCLPPAPDGWTGPVAAGIDVAPECPSEYPDVAGDFGHTPDADPAVCDCQCTGCSQASCHPVVQFYDSVQCAGSVSSSTSKCAAIPDNGYYVTSPWPTTNNAADITCDTEVEPILPAASWKVQSRMCSRDSDLGPCSSGACFPTVGAPLQHCIFRVGNYSCPQEYPTYHSKFSGFEEGRACECTPCETEVSCFYVSRVETSNCNLTGSTVQALDGTGCVGNDIKSTSNYVKSVVDVTSVTSTSVGTPTGGVDEVDPVTICCLE